jgi:hypothetical protein
MIDPSFRSLIAVIGHRQNEGSTALVVLPSVGRESEVEADLSRQ